MENNTLIKNSPLETRTLLLALYIQFSFINLAAPISTYGTELLGIFLITAFAISCEWQACKQHIPVVFAITFFIVAISFIHHLNLPHTEILWPITIRTLFWIFAAFLSYPYFQKITKRNLEAILACLIIINSFLVFIQFISLYAFNYNIDFSLLIGGVNSRTQFNNLYRPTGLTAEPAFLAGYLFGLVTLLFILKKKSCIATCFGISAIMLSMSFWGILAVSSLVFISLFNISTENRRLVINKNEKIILLFFITAALVIYFAQEFGRPAQTIEATQPRPSVENIFTGKDGSNSTKIDTIKNMLNSPYLLMLGYGFTSNSKTSPPFYEGLYDVTFFGANISTFGVPLGVLIDIFTLWLLFKKSSFDHKGKILCVVALSKISTPTRIFFPCFILLLFIANKKITEDT